MQGDKYSFYGAPAGGKKFSTDNGTNIVIEKSTSIVYTVEDSKQAFVEGNVSYIKVEIRNMVQGKYEVARCLCAHILIKGENRL